RRRHTRFSRDWSSDVCSSDLAQFMMGASQTLLQTAVNPYVVKIGPEESAAARISIMGILNKSAGVVAPMVFFALILGGMKDYSRSEERRVGQRSTCSSSRCC